MIKSPNDLPDDFGTVPAKSQLYTPFAGVAARAAAVERERCARIVEQFAGVPTHKLRRLIAEAIRNPNTWWEPRENA